MPRYGVGLIAIAMATGCDWAPQYCEGDWAAAPPETAPPVPRTRTVAQVLPADSTAVDILFVIDDSASMTDEQAQLGIWSHELFDVLSAAGELPDLHIAVTSSSVPIPEFDQCRSGGGGTLHVGGAELTDGDFIRDVASPLGRERNYAGTLEDAFAKLARVGDSGCGFEQPFKAARMALQSKQFVRDDALLLVVFVTDEDDCSATSAGLYADQYGDACSDLGTMTDYRCFEFGVTCFDGKGSREFGERAACRPAESSPYLETVASFAAFLKDLKPNPAQVVVAGIYGKPNGIQVVPDERFPTYPTPRLASVCGGNGSLGSGATPAIRMNALMAEFGGRASQSSICEAELSWAMRDVGLVTRGAATRSHCLRGDLMDADPLAPGVQPTCHVEIASDAGTELERRSDVPPCDGANSLRCFTIESDADCDTQLAFRVDGSGANETLTVSCE